MKNTKKQLYPLKFIPVSKEKVWGGDKLARNFGKPFESNNPIGESWEICGFEEDSSVIAEGFLENNSLYDILETYMGEIVGEEHYKYFGNEFPLLIKLLDIKDLLSVQVHPDDETAFDRHNSYGKNEAWYILDSEPDAIVYMGFNRDITPTEFYERCKAGTLEEVLNKYHPQKGDFFYIEAGIVHSAGHGLVIAEVQQLSDVTYRIYDWGRENNPATARELHLDLAFDCINYKKYDKEKYFVPSGGIHLAKNKYFNINSYELTDSLHIYTEKFQSFILYFCVEGAAKITPDSFGSTTNNEYNFSKGEWILIPAEYEDFVISSTVKGTKILETYIEIPQEEPDSYIEDHDHSHDNGCSCGCDHNH
jgi:mannose-6-phosphate isomerase